MWLAIVRRSVLWSFSILYKWYSKLQNSRAGKSKALPSLPMQSIERIAWIVVLVLVGFVLFSSIQQYLMSRKEYDLRTYISLRPADQVPFPSVIIQSQGLADPMHLTKKSGNMVNRLHLPQQGIPNTQIVHLTKIFFFRIERTVSRHILQIMERVST